MPDIKLFSVPKLSFLSKEQVYDSSKKINILKKDNRCTATDFAAILGEVVYNDEFIDDSKSLKSRCARWHTSSLTNDVSGFYLILGNKKNDSYYFREILSVGIRPFLPFSSIKNLDGGLFKKSHTIELFEFPQYVPSNEICQILEMKYRAGTLKKTGKS